ncbi:MAG: ribonuclease P protein component [Flavobacteriales bacterium]|nr:ribonuclease P protein component [Flavobacteriales bacterium]MCB9178101.1 ribonuclease P protein component [Flavobacteriales bacterium]HPF90482.1 ribonuclease P protein component [Flavobacteriales bacterium]
MERPTFSKHERLTGRLRITEVVEKGRTVQESPIKLVGRIMELPTTAPAQVAFAIPKRYMKLAVHRNRMRRLMREAYRLHKAASYGRLREEGRQCAWLFIYQGRQPLTLAETRERLSRLLHRWMEKHG